MKPMRLNYLLLLFVSAGLLAACDQTGTEISPPIISAQGFVIENVQHGTIGQFGDLRLRFESEARIKKLLIKERSYEVDLASTTENDHFQLFGIERKTALYTDITLDFQNYVNKKLEHPGKYEFEIKVVDKNDQPTTALLMLHLQEPQGEITPIETNHFKLQREGKDQVSGSDQFGITWKTIDEVLVTIQISKAQNGATKLARLDQDTYSSLNNKEELQHRINSSTGVDLIEFDTANNAAAQEVIGVLNQGKYYILRTNLSETLLSQIGTTVTLDGEYKY